MLSDEIIDFLESEFKVPIGQNAGKKLVLMPWQLQFIRGAFAPDIEEAHLSIARSAGKSATIGALLAATMLPKSPLYIAGGECVCVASSLNQAGICVKYAAGFLRSAGIELVLRNGWIHNDSVHQAFIAHRPTSTRIAALSADPARMHGRGSGLLLIADEPAQHPALRAPKIASALRTSRGKIPGSRFIAIGTKPEAADHWFSNALANPGVGVYSQIHAVAPDTPMVELGKRSTWLEANPSLPFFPALERIITNEFKNAKTPDLMASFRSLRLNMGESDVSISTLITPEDWLELEGERATGRRADLRS